MARPKEFNRNEVIYKAMLVFWKKGYDGTSIPDLLEASGISRSSLYETFIDKQNLFLETMKSYRKLIGENGLQLILNYLSDAGCKKESPLNVIHKYFKGRIKTALDPRFPGGCFITNVATTLETADSSVRSAVIDHIKKTEQAFRDILNHCREKGEIPKDSDTEELALYLLGIANGINVLARLGRNMPDLEKIVKTSLDSIIK